MKSTITRSHTHRGWMRVIIALIAAAVFGAVSPAIPASADAPVTFNDPHLEAKVRTALGSPSGSITQSMMASLNTLDISGANISDLSGLEYATQLHYLVATDNHISELSPLVGLVHLQQLTLWNNNISDLSDLSGLENLTFLSIGYNPYTSIAVLSGLSKLTLLAVNSSGVTDLTPVASFPDLTYLGLSGAPVSDLGPLATLSHLETLYAAQIQVSDLSPLSGLTSLSYLDIDDDPVASLVPLAGLTNLRELYASNIDGITDASPLAGLTELRYLGLSGTQLYDISALALLNAGSGSIYLDYNWLDLTAGSPADQVITTLTARGYTVVATPQRAGGKVSGVVTDSLGTPVVGVGVSVDTGQQTTTAADGTYAFARLKPGARTLTFTKANYATAIRTPTADADVPATADATLAANPGTISGTVSSGGKAVSGVTVSLDGSPATTTATDGSYTVPASAGRHTLTFTKAYYLDVAATPTVPAGTGTTANVTLTPVQLGQTITRSPNKATITVKRKHGKATIVLSATFSDSRGAITGQAVQLQRSTNGKAKWKSVTTRLTDMTGTASVTITVKRRQTVYYRWYTATTAADLTKTSPKLKVKIR